MWGELEAIWTRLALQAGFFSWKQVSAEEWTLTLAWFLAASKQLLLDALDRDYSAHLEDNAHLINTSIEGEFISARMEDSETSFAPWG
eukprot:9469483-Pyramimonas_sp.AAC.1